MGLLHEIRNLNFIEEQKLAKEEKKTYELEFEKDITLILESKIFETLEVENENAIYLKRQEIINSTLEELKNLTKEDTDIKEEVVAIQKYNILPENEFEVERLINNNFPIVAKRIITERKQFETTQLNELANTFTAICEVTYLNLRQQGQLKADIVKVMRSKERLNLFIKNYSKDYYADTIEKALEKATSTVLKKYSHDKDTAKDKVKLKWNNLPLAYKALGANILLSKFTKRWGRSHRYNFK